MTSAQNPFYVLELAPDCTRAEVERAGQKILAMLELGLRGGDRYETPWGSRSRDAAAVREAMAELRDPQRRLFHELWAIARPWNASRALGVEPRTSLLGSAEDDPLGFGGAHSALGWRS